MSKGSYENAMKNIKSLRDEYATNDAVRLLLDILEGALTQLESEGK